MVVAGVPHMTRLDKALVNLLTKYLLTVIVQKCP